MYIRDSKFCDVSEVCESKSEGTTLSGRSLNQQTHSDIVTAPPIAGFVISDHCKIPIHLLCDLKAYHKELALFFSLKAIYQSGYIKDFEKLDLSLLGYRVCRETYLKYIYTLATLGLVHGDYKTKDKKTKKGRKIVNMWLVGQNQILKLYPTGRYNLEYVTLPNDKKLKNNIEKLVFSRNSRAQTHKIEKSDVDNVKASQLLIISKPCDGSDSTKMVVPDNTTNLSCQSLANLLGYKHKATGSRRWKKWKEEGFVSIQSRVYELGKLSKEVLGEVRRIADREKKHIFTSMKGITYQRLANSQTILTPLI